MTWTVRWSQVANSGASRDQVRLSRQYKCLCSMYNSFVSNKFDDSVTISESFSCFEKDTYVGPKNDSTRFHSLLVLQNRDSEVRILFQPSFENDNVGLLKYTTGVFSGRQAS